MRPTGAILLAALTLPSADAQAACAPKATACRLQALEETLDRNSAAMTLLLNRGISTIQENADLKRQILELEKKVEEYRSTNDAIKDKLNEYNTTFKEVFIEDIKINTQMMKQYLALNGLWRALYGVTLDEAIAKSQP